MAGTSLIRKGLQALQKGRVQRASKPKKSSERPKAITAKKSSERPEAITARQLQMYGASPKTRQQRKIYEAQKGAKKAERGTKTEQVAERVLPKVGYEKGMSAKLRTQLKGMSASDIAEEYSGKEITAMKRKIKDPRILARLQKAGRKRETIAKKFIAENQGFHRKGFLRQATPAKQITVPKAGTRAAELAGRALKKGGVAKRKSGGKMQTDGNAYVASLYTGGKVGG